MCGGSAWMDGTSTSMTAKGQIRKTNKPTTNAIRADLKFLLSHNDHTYSSDFGNKNQHIMT